MYENKKVDSVWDLAQPKILIISKNSSNKSFPLCQLATYDPYEMKMRRLKHKIVSPEDVPQQWRDEWRCLDLGDVILTNWSTMSNVF